MSGNRQLEDEIVAAIRRITQAVDLHSRRLLAECGVTGPQLAVLRAAGRAQATPIGSIARSVQLSQATVTGIVDRLEQRGLLERRRNDQDRRAVNIRVTGAGRRLLAEGPSLLRERFREHLATIPDWQGNLTLAALQQVAEMMASEPARTRDRVAGAEPVMATSRG